MGATGADIYSTVGVVWCDVAMVGVTVLDREVYAEAEAARLLAMPQSTLHYWLEGRTQGGHTYLPILREQVTSRRVVTWGEFVEAALLRGYRNQKVPMPQLRAFIERLREETGAPYPLAEHRPWVSGTDLLFAAQEEADLPPEFWLVSNGQGLLTYPGDAFVHRVTWAEGIAQRLRPPVASNESPVVIDPLQRFGRPSIAGVSTAALADEVEAGATVEEVAEDFGISAEDVRWAVAYENESANAA
ncbi:DUF433 domain-containing protein [Calidifontibacter sp. DB0510]|uniref:DUF433 domain-containing protein n=1 Tax=Metallococcus carri TaxID=1656884 RepID=A0A967B1Q7_9MICO|nr:DUF433 domain-containing protein [Metallococcus carri]NHN56394.1 DUF433 domain-containing protein [Metallococcus carri]NOP36018.1 DUF433 domain-containing protein [Calidifontibacter sp. DB2511S]